MPKKNGADIFPNSTFGMIDENDMELIIAYAENRLDGKTEKLVKRRLGKEPELRKALSELVISARGTEYEKILQKSLESDHIHSGVQKIISEFLAECFRMPVWRSAGAVAAALLVAVIYGVYQKHSGPPAGAVPIHIQLMASADKMPQDDMRGGTDSNIFELKPGDTLSSGSYFKLYIDAEKNSYINVWLHDSSGELTALFSGKKGTDKPLVISDGPDGFQLDDHTGTEIIHVLSSASEIRNREQVAALLREGEADSLAERFPGISHRAFRFIHQ